MEKKITGEERTAAKLRIDLQDHENTRSQLQDEVFFSPLISHEIIQLIC